MRSRFPVPIRALMRSAHAVQAAVLAVAAGLYAPAAQAETLVMVEEVGCIYCAQFNAQIAPAYPKTAEGRFAPIRRVEITDPVPADLHFDAPAVFTPTFVLVDDDGQELARIEGYPGQEFFWPLLSAMLTEHTDFDPNAPTPAASSPDATAPDAPLAQPDMTEASQG